MFALTVASTARRAAIGRSSLRAGRVAASCAAAAALAHGAACCACSWARIVRWVAVICGRSGRWRPKLARRSTSTRDSRSRERACGQHVGDRIAAAVLVGGHQLLRQHRLGRVQAARRRQSAAVVASAARAAASCARAVASCAAATSRRVCSRSRRCITARPVPAESRPSRRLGGRSGRDDQRQHDQRSGQCARQGMNPPAMCQLCSPRKQTGCPQRPYSSAGTLPLPPGVASRRQPVCQEIPANGGNRVTGELDSGPSLGNAAPEHDDRDPPPRHRYHLRRLRSHRAARRAAGQLPQDRAGGRDGVRAVRRPGRRAGLDAGGRTGPAGAAGRPRGARPARAAAAAQAARDGAGAVRSRAAARGSGGRRRGQPRAVQREHASAHRLGHRAHARRSPGQRGAAQPPRGGRDGGVGPVLVPVPGGHAGRADRHAAAPGRGAGPSSTAGSCEWNAQAEPDGTVLLAS